MTKNFKLEEFEIATSAYRYHMAKDVNVVPLEIKPLVRLLAEQLQIIRNVISMPIYITSGYRSPKYNAIIGGSKSSYHMKGMAADIKTDMNIKQLHNIIETMMDNGEIMQGGLGLYNSFIHYDIRGSRVRW